MRFRAKGPQGESPGHRPGLTGPPYRKAPTGRNNAVQHRRFRPVGALVFVGLIFPGALPQAFTFCPVGAESQMCNAVDDHRPGDIELIASIPNIPFIERDFIFTKELSKLILKCHFAVMFLLAIEVLFHGGTVRRAD